MPDNLSAATKLPGTALPPELLPETLEALTEWGQRRYADRKPTGAGSLQPTFPYADLPLSERLTYELVGGHNVGAYLPLFANDPSPYLLQPTTGAANAESGRIGYLSQRSFFRLPMQIHLPDNAPIRLSGPDLLMMSDAEFYDFCQQHTELRIERTANHEILVVPPTGSTSGNRNAEIILQLGLWNKQQRLGYIFDSSTGFTLPDGSVLSPDASWVSAEKWNALTQEQQDKFAPICPEFVVELKSAKDSTETLHAKMLDWLRNGAQLAWLLVPDTETAYLYRPGQPAPEVVQGFEHELSGEAVLPGFRLRLAELA